jgi:hypothetical protein
MIEQTNTNLTLLKGNGSVFFPYEFKGLGISDEEMLLAILDWKPDQSPSYFYATVNNMGFIFQPANRKNPISIDTSNNAVPLEEREQCLTEALRLLKNR